MCNSLQIVLKLRLFSHSLFHPPTHFSKQRWKLLWKSLKMVLRPDPYTSFFLPPNQRFHTCIIEPAYWCSSIVTEKNHFPRKTFLVQVVVVFREWHDRSMWPSCSINMCGISCVRPCRPSFVLLQHFLLGLYLILSPDLIRIHWGMGWLYSCFLARNHWIIQSFARRHSKEQSIAYTTVAEKGRERATQFSLLKSGDVGCTGFFFSRQSEHVTRSPAFLISMVINISSESTCSPPHFSSWFLSDASKFCVATGLGFQR